MGLLDKLPESPFGIKGVKPETRENALPTSQLHAQGAGTDWTNTAEHSVLDYDAKTPPTYRDLSPEGASF
jgi:hypothetical protein